MEETKNIINTDGPLNDDAPLPTDEMRAKVAEDAVPTDAQEPAAAPATLTENQKDIQTYDDLVYDKYVEIVNTKVYNAQMIISFMLDNGLDVDEQMLRKVAEARETVNTPKWNDVECKFMMTYNELVKRIYPVSIEMINNPSKIDKVELSGTILGKSNREKRKKNSAIVYSVITGCFVLLLLGVQIFYFLGSTRLNNINNTNSELEKTLFRQRELQILTTSAPENLSYELELEDNMSKTAELNNSLQSNILLLEPWTKILSALTFNTRENKDIDTKEKENMKTNIEVIQEAKGYALILGIYILPLLYGLIGGLTYVLREMRSDVRKYTLDKESTIKYILRIILGAVAGLSVGLFWSDIENAQAVGFTSISLSPMLLAFIAGYCVEHVLGFIDKIIKNVFDNLMPKSKRNDEELLTKSGDDTPQGNGNPAANKGKSTTAKPANTAKTASTLPQPTKLSYFAEKM